MMTTLSVGQTVEVTAKQYAGLIGTIVNIFGHGRRYYDVDTVNGVMMFLARELKPVTAKEGDNATQEL